MTNPSNLQHPGFTGIKAPLAGKTILVTRACHQAEAFIQALENLGAMVLHCPLIQISTIDLSKNPIPDLTAYDWVIVTSQNAVECFFAQLDPSVYANVLPQSIIAIGPETQKALEKFGFPNVITPQTYIAEGILEAITAIDPHLSGKRILLPRAKTARDVLPMSLKSYGCLVDILPVYETRMIDVGAETNRLIEWLQEEKIDWMTFTSGSTVEALATHLGPSLKTSPWLLKDTLLASIGPQTSQALLTRFQRVDCQATAHTTQGLIQAILDYNQRHSTPT